MAFYHMSTDGSLEGIWTPHAVRDIYKDCHKGPLSEPHETKKISVSPSIEKCWWALFPKFQGWFEEGCPSITFYVYSPKIDLKTKMLDNSEIVKRNYVYDAHLTKETWITSDVYMERISRIRIINTLDKGLRDLPVFGNSAAGNTFTIPKVFEFKLEKNYSPSPRSLIW